MADLAIELGYESLLFIDEAARPGETIFSYPVVRQHMPERYADAIVAIGDNVKRQQLFELIAAQRRVSLRARDAYVSSTASLEPGCFVGHRAYVGPLARIGPNCILNTACIVEHEVVVGAHTHVAINATIAGRCSIGEFCLIGAAATVLDGLSICHNVVVGGGAVVVESIEHPGVYVGVPARKIK